MKTINEELLKIWRLKLEFINIMTTGSYAGYESAAKENREWDVLADKFTLLELEMFNTRMNLLFDQKH